MAASTRTHHRRPARRVSVRRTPSWLRSRWTPAIRALAIGLLSTPILLSACTFEGYVPKEAPPEVSELEPMQGLVLGVPKYGTLDCPAGECQQHYRFDVEHAGELVAILDPDYSGSGVGLRMTLGNVVGRILGQQRAEGEEPVEIRSRVEPGVYYVLVQTIGGKVRYELLVALSHPETALP